MVPSATSAPSNDVEETTPLQTARDFRPDLVVVGAGMGGISCARRATRLGARVLVVEPGLVGGT